MNHEPARPSLRLMARTLVLPALVLLAPVGLAGQAAVPEPVPRILLDQSPRAIDYQLARLSDDQLSRVERRADDVRYVPVYYALLTRPAMPEAIRDEAIAALRDLEGASGVAVVLEALQRVREAAAAAPLLRRLLALPASDLAAGRAVIAASAERADASPFALQGVYVAIMLGDGEAGAGWDASTARAGHRAQLLRGLTYLPANPEADAMRRQLAPRVAATVAAPADEEEYIAAVGAVAATRRDAEAFGLLAAEITRNRHPDAVASAVLGAGLIPSRVWPQEDVAALVRVLVDRVTALSPDERTEREALDSIGLAERLAGVLPASRALRADLRALGVRVVRIETRFEQVAFDLRWFVVEAGKPVQIVFFNPDAMPHNIVIGTPGSLELIGTSGGAMPMSTDPSVKPFVPNLPQVLHATRLVGQGETERIGFVAPDAPGEYLFVCTFPGHWVRMYGVMLVVSDLEAWEARPAVPTDPMTGQPLGAQRAAE